jgi:hypothetical protein
MIEDLHLGAPAPQVKVPVSVKLASLRDASDYHDPLQDSAGYDRTGPGVRLYGPG